jgi:hypothetical protein
VTVPLSIPELAFVDLSVLQLERAVPVVQALSFSALVLSRSQEYTFFEFLFAKINELAPVTRYVPLEALGYSEAQAAQRVLLCAFLYLNASSADSVVHEVLKVCF